MQDAEADDGRHRCLRFSACKASLIVSNRLARPTTGCGESALVYEIGGVRWIKPLRFTHGLLRPVIQLPLNRQQVDCHFALDSAI